MAAQILALYQPPADVAAFDAYCYGTHVPLAKNIPGLRSYVTNRGEIAAAAGTSPYHLVAMLNFDSVEAIQAAMASPEGQATLADVPKFASGGVVVLTLDLQTV